MITFLVLFYAFGICWALVAYHGIPGGNDNVAIAQLFMYALLWPAFAVAAAFMTFDEWRAAWAVEDQLADCDWHYVDDPYKGYE